MKNRRIQRSKSQWAKLVLEWRRSGKSQRQFAEEQGVGASRLSAWAKQLPSGSSVKAGKRKGSQRSSTSFSEVLVVEPHEEQMSGIVEVTTPTGYVVRVTGEMAPDALRAVLRQVGQC